MRTTSQKPNRESRAAYGPSQPLFDALRTARENVGEQKLHLTKARDVVQGLHVDHVNTTNIDDQEKHEQYVDYVMKAWTSVTHSYCKIFEELCKISAADVSKGTKASKGYAHFKVMADTAAAASRQVKDFRDAKETEGFNGKAAHDKVEPITPGKRARDLEDDEDDNEPAVGGGVDRTRTKHQRKRTRKANAKKIAGPGGKTEGRNNGVKVKVEDVEDEVKIKLEPFTPQQHRAHPQPAPEATPVAAGKENNAPAVEYEDVSAEVAARLKAKEEKKKAKKEEKKRKRESGDSAVAEVPMVEKPITKRVKIAGTPVKPNGAVKEPTMKRRQDDGIGQEGVGVPAKRRKSKA